MPAPRQAELLPFRVRSQRNPGWHWAQNEVVEKWAPILGIYAVGVYYVLACFSRENQVEDVSWQRIAGLLGVSRGSVFKALAQLEKHGLILKRSKPGGKCTYILLELKPAPVHQVNQCTESNPSTKKTAPVHQVNGSKARVVHRVNGSKTDPSTRKTGVVHSMNGTRSPGGRDKGSKTQDSKTLDSHPPTPRPLESVRETLTRQLQQQLQDYIVPPSRLRAPGDRYTAEQYRRYFAEARVRRIEGSEVVLEAADPEALREGLVQFGGHVRHALRMALGVEVEIRVAEPDAGVEVKQ